MFPSGTVVAAKLSNTIVTVSLRNSKASKLATIIKIEPGKGQLGCVSFLHRTAYKTRGHALYMAVKAGSNGLVVQEKALHCLRPCTASDNPDDVPLPLSAPNLLAVTELRHIGLAVTEA